MLTPEYLIRSITLEHGHDAALFAQQRCDSFFRTLDATEDTEDALLHIYCVIDAYLRAGDFAMVDAILMAVPNLPTVQLLAFLSITKPAAHELSSRTYFAKRVRAHLETIEPDRVERLLAGLE